jgi:hypothetical protein
VRKHRWRSKNNGDEELRGKEGVTSTDLVPQFPYVILAEKRITIPKFEFCALNKKNRFSRPN